MSFIDSALGGLAANSATDAGKGKKTKPIVIIGFIGAGAAGLYLYKKHESSSAATPSATTSTGTSGTGTATGQGAGLGSGGGGGGTGWRHWQPGQSAGTASTGTASTGTSSTSTASTTPVPAPSATAGAVPSTITTNPVPMLTPITPGGTNTGSQVSVPAGSSAATVAQAASQALSSYVAGGPPATVAVGGVTMPAAQVASNPTFYANGGTPATTVVNGVTTPTEDAAGNVYTPAQLAAQSAAGETGTPVTVNGITYANAAIAKQYGA